MTNKEASNVLRLFANLIEINGLPEERILTFRKAYEQAISKLESDTTPQGEWIKDNSGNRFCSECGNSALYHEIGLKFESRFCPNCGLSMKKGGAE